MTIEEIKIGDHVSFINNNYVWEIGMVDEIVGNYIKIILDDKKYVIKHISEIFK